MQRQPGSEFKNFLSDKAMRMVAEPLKGPSFKRANQEIHHHSKIQESEPKEKPEKQFPIQFAPQQSHFIPEGAIQVVSQHNHESTEVVKSRVATIRMSQQNYTSPYQKLKELESPGNLGDAPRRKSRKDIQEEAALNQIAPLHTIDLKLPPIKQLGQLNFEKLLPGMYPPKK